MAAAGSGKTAVLVERIIQIILKDKIDIINLMIQFTNAAAEMRKTQGNYKGIGEDENEEY